MCQVGTDTLNRMPRKGPLEKEASEQGVGGGRSPGQKEREPQAPREHSAEREEEEWSQQGRKK